MSAFFNASAIVQPHVRHDDERRSAEGALREKARKYQSALETLLNGPNIPTSVYTRLDRRREQESAGLPSLSQSAQADDGRDQLHYYDLYAPLVGSTNLRYTPEEAQKHVLAAVAPLGAEYSGDDPARVRQPLDRSVPERRQACRARTRTAAPTTSIRTC